MVTATAASRVMLDSASMSADRILIDAIRRAPSDGRNVTLVDDPVAADVIVFAESHQNDHAIEQILGEELYKGFRSKCVVHSGMDHPLPLVPGLYSSISRKWARLLGCQGSPYLAAHNHYLQCDAPGAPAPSKLASFLGCCEGKPVRERLLKIARRDGWADVVVRDSGAEFVGSIRSGAHEVHDQLKRQFAADMLDAKFALCPAGTGPSSFRIFEAMQCGRAPVVVSDNWTPPPGPAWESFSIRVPASKLAKLPLILMRYSDRWRELGAMAREQWERHYGPESLGPGIVRDAMETLTRANARPWSRAFYAWVYAHGPRRLAELRVRLAAKAGRLLQLRRSRS